MAWRCRAVAQGEKLETTVERLTKLSKANQRDARRGELARKRDAVEALSDVANYRQVSA